MLKTESITILNESLWDVPKTAKHLGVSESYIRHGTRKKNPLPGRPPFVRIGRCVRFRPSDVNNWIASKTENGEAV
jgi:predicted DNA-binding transcriptional regulator AlpA